MAGSLTAFKVKSAQPGRHSDGGGLLLLVKPNGRRYWFVRVMSDGKRRDFGLGDAGINGVGLAEARTKAEEIRKAVKGGTDPVAAKREAVAGRKAALSIASERTFEAVAGQFLEKHISTLKSPKHRSLWRSTLETYAFPVLAKRPIDAITGPMVIDALEAVWTRAPETSRRVRQRIAAVLDYAHARGWRGPKPDLSALTSKALPKHTEGVKHHAAVPYPDAPVVLAALHSEPGTMGRLALLFTIYTAARSGETRGATWAEIDTAKAEWTIPADRMKAKKPHTVPLSTPALAVLEAAAKVRKTGKGIEPLFPGSGGRSLSDMTMSAAHRATAPGSTVHGWRSTFRDWAAETTTFPADVCEAALAHSFGGKVQQAYQRGDLLVKRRKLMDAWARYLAGIPAERRKRNAVQ